jgi:hypothetical protein
MPPTWEHMEGRWQLEAGMGDIGRALQNVDFDDEWYWVASRLRPVGFGVGRLLGDGAYGQVRELVDHKQKPTGQVIKLTADLNEVAAAHRMLASRDETTIFPKIYGAWWGTPGNFGFIIREDVERDCYRASRQLCSLLGATYTVRPPIAEQTFGDLRRLGARLGPKLKGSWEHFWSEVDRVAAEHGLVFWDLGANNVRVRRTDPPEMVITDFGLSSGQATEVPVAANPKRSRLSV